MTAIKATLHSYKSLATRKQLQITLEVPEEYAGAALKMLGVPDPGGVQWFALARIVEGASAAPQAVEPTPEPKRERKRSEIAKFKCQDQEFQQWVCAGTLVPLDHPGPASPQELAEHADRILKRTLGITSKKELDTNASKAIAWDSLLCDFDTKDIVRR